MTRTPISQNGTPLPQSPSLADRLTEKLRAAIVSNRFTSGASLPSEGAVAKEFGVGRTTVREAVSRLKQQGLITTRQGSRAFVAPLEMAETLHLAHPDPANAAELRNMIELLMAVEAKATSLAAERRTPGELETILRARDKLNAAIRSGSEGSDEDFAFHLAIYSASGNPLFVDVSRYLEGRVRAFIRTARSNTARLAPELVQAVQEEHDRIASAIERGAADEARAAAEIHLANAEARLAECLRR